MIPENGFSFGNLVSRNDVYTKIPKFLEYVPVFSFSFLALKNGETSYSNTKKGLQCLGPSQLKSYGKEYLINYGVGNVFSRDNGLFYTPWSSLYRTSIGSNSLCRNIFHISTFLEYYARTGLIQGSGFLATTEPGQSRYYLNNIIPKDFLYMFVIKSEYAVEACYRAEGELTFDSNMFEFWVHPNFLDSKYARLRTKMQPNFEKLAEYGINIVFTTDFLRAFAPKRDVPKDLDELKEYKKAIVKPILAKVIEEYGTHGREGTIRNPTTVTVTSTSGVYEPPQESSALPW